MGPHAGTPMRYAGPPVEEAAGVVVMLHGRGASAEDILSLHGALGIGSLGAVAPEAAGGTWYPYSFLAPLESNQPFLDSALSRVESVVSGLLAAGVAGERIGVLGFSQGACLACEFVARRPRRYGAVIALTGGLIGPEGTAREYKGSLDGTPVLLAAGDPDPHVPFRRVEETAKVLEGMGAEVEVRRYPGKGHMVSGDELEAARGHLLRMIGEGRGGGSDA